MSDLECPFCLSRERPLGGIALLTPTMMQNVEADIQAGHACVDCLSLIAQLLDGLKGGRIRELVNRLILNGALRRN